ncbi:hypothetical protein, partial [Rhizobium sp. FKL33]|uniref:hypothetical protein n=1 Tax=Rhizobium sp. FKL33 TaxID=2562307 RepID=UPI001FED41CE
FARMRVLPAPIELERVSSPRMSEVAAQLSLVATLALNRACLEERRTVTRAHHHTCQFSGLYKGKSQRLPQKEV